ncbi:caspase family protein [Arcicella rigui]|uniref:Caspase family protein n=1 Tax=Arcicella rigui TaxID=797020 RepID=A0ABU5Q7S0_9BACT|nr:caspase family protein [Arcicella rigui]MEA5138622.1 caspase family protein [Arcicella rigui]
MKTNFTIIAKISLNFRHHLLGCLVLIFYFATTNGFSQTKSFTPNLVINEEKRLALVIGNKEYIAAHASLKNSANDAEDMTKELTRLGFKVMTYYNLSKKDFLIAIDEFGIQLKNYNVGLFYYSGHGGQSRGESYLIPSDITLNSSLEYDCVSLGRVLEKMEEAQVKVNLAFIDACRTNPLERKKAMIGQGLAIPNNPSGSMVVYATEAGTPARDDHENGRNGLFTGELLSQLRENPTLGLRSMLDNTSEGVEKLSNKTQEPGRYDKLKGDFFFLKGNKVLPVSTESYDDISYNIQQGEMAFDKKIYDDAYRFLNTYREHALFKPTNLNQLAYMYDMGYGAKQNYAEAFKLYQKAASLDNALAAYNLGIMYERGLGTVADYKSAAEWYKKAANQNLALAQFNLGFLYEKGLGVNQSYTEAFNWYLKAAENGDSDGQVNVGYLYENGLGTTKDIREASKWYRKAAEQADADGQYNLARLNVSLSDGQEEFTLYANAAEQGHIGAQINLGYLYEVGRNVAKNQDLATTWYQKAANQGNAIAQFNLGVQYESKKFPLSPNYREAINWYEKAAKQDFGLALYNLAILHENGKGTVRDMKIANEYYKKAAKQDILGAQRALARFGLKW